MAQAETRMPTAGTVHYQALCGLCLGLIFLVQLDQGHYLPNLLLLAVGTLGLVARLRVAPILLLLFLAGPTLIAQVTRHRLVLVERRGRGELDIADIVLCAAVLGYVAGHYRLQALWYNVLPVDPRQRPAQPVTPAGVPWFRRRRPFLQSRAPGQITPQEIVWLVLALPLWAVLAQIVWALLPRRWEAAGLSPRLAPLVVLAWLLGTGFFLVRSGLHVWKHRQRDAQQARLFLQDALWKETRGEQRTINRWLVWRTLRREHRSHEP